jgi:hypothetical protein
MTSPLINSKGYTLIGTYMSTLIMQVMSTTYERLFRQGYESLILGDLNAHM